MSGGKIMSIDFTKSTTENATVQPVAVVEAKELPAVDAFDIQAEKQQIVAKYQNSPEIDRLTSEIKVYEPNSIIVFGSDVTESISKASDAVLNNTNMAQLNETSKMMQALTKIMSNFNIDDFKEDPKGLAKIFTNAKKQLDKFLAKYQTVGGEIDKIYVQLKQYQSEIQQSNKHLEEMFDGSIEQYHTLEKYIIAGDRGIEEVKNYLDGRRAEFEKTQDNEIGMEIQNLEQALQLLEARVQDMRLAEHVAMQSIPMIRTMEFSNLNLARKIDSAFIITLPVFKQAVAQAILLKKQKIQADAMAELDAKTNEMLQKNAQNTVAQSKMITQMASSSSIQIETIEKNWQIIMNGIQETNAIREQMSQKREADKLRLEQIKQEFNEQHKIPQLNG